MADRLNKKHRAIHECIKSNPNQTVIFIHDAVKLKISTTQHYLSDLKHAGLIITTTKESSRGRIKYKATDKDFDVAAAEYAPEPMDRADNYAVQSDLPDPLLEKAITHELTDDQWHYIRANPTLSRREIAKKLGIERTVLLAAIDRRKERERGD